MTSDDPHPDSGSPSPPVDDDLGAIRVLFASMQPTCTGCRYDLRGLPPEVDRCPECGTRFDPIGRTIPVRTSVAPHAILITIIGIGLGLIGLCSGTAIVTVAIIVGPALGLALAMRGGRLTRLIISDTGIQLLGKNRLAWADLRSVACFDGRLHITATRFGERPVRLRCRFMRTSGVDDGPVVNAIDALRRRAGVRRLGADHLTFDARRRDPQLLIARSPGGILLEVLIVSLAMSCAIAFFLVSREVMVKTAIWIVAAESIIAFVPVCNAIARATRPITIRAGRAGIDIDGAPSEPTDGFFRWDQIESIELRGRTLRVRPRLPRLRHPHYLLRADASKIATLEALIREHGPASRDRAS
ncbi:MAG: hypothetical protein KDA25_07710 [Phycisphaerales bacterium]|nr:hypothetical protein [Phycisphaerales bacterium]